MTETFWIAAAVLIILAIAFVLYPVLFHRTGSTERTDLKNQNLMAYRTRRKELDEEFEAGALDEETYEQMKEELAGSMLDDVEEGSFRSSLSSGRRSARVVGLLAILLIPAATFLLYEEWGAMDRVEQYITMQQMGDSNAARAEQMSGLVEQLRDKLEASPDNPDGWAMLGQSYMRLERYRDAAWAFQRLSGVTDTESSRAVALGLAAQALFFDSEGELTPDVTAAIDAAREVNPDEVNALGLLGIHAFSQEQYREAIGFWERIISVAPDHPQIAAIQGGIDEAYRRLGEEPPAQEIATSGPGVTVRVALDDAFKGLVPEDTTLFIFARQVGGQAGPPLAIARLSASSLPVEVRLDDSRSMSPQAKISAVDEVLITARLSRSGTAMAQPGDWQGSIVDPVAVTDGNGDVVEVVIDKQLTN
ncbi:c-type cytochrome biogenesis protein CcmI [Marinobacter salinexigens]|uniref:C-type cytochrome biogenesis protein CcmI n=1 Tax=Marinobacter salinexigens TaxID=2919747 RepID=A0A5B0VK68_9GAMM|nr:c-type cytochrome biogenesis protein CcmI [Marinobacter salinexigens]KAA1174818.1 c-type cytochrome biogenesis protein CcmI [Marinobacter salinexigens]